MGLWPPRLSTPSASESRTSMRRAASFSKSPTTRAWGNASTAVRPLLVALTNNSPAERIRAMRDEDEETAEEREARLNGLSYVKLDGEIGCMVNGAGLAMATMDIIKYFGGSPANFLDVGGGAKADKVAAALRIILSDPNVKAVLFNIFGGITRCDEVARGILQALAEVPTQVPMVVRLVGTNYEEGRAILAEAKMATAETLAEAAQKAVAAAHNA